MKVSRPFLTALFASLISLVAPTVLRADNIAYAVNQVVGIGSASGTITTDGTIGTLGVGNIASWDLTLNDGTNTIHLLPTNSIDFVAGADLTAAATQIMFNFDGAVFSRLEFFDPTGPATFGGVCFATAPPNACNAQPAGIILESLGNDFQFPTVGESGIQVIASVTDTPEPATSSLMLIGVGLVFVAWKSMLNLPARFRP